MRGALVVKGLKFYLFVKIQHSEDGFHKGFEWRSGRSCLRGINVFK